MKTTFLGSAITALIKIVPEDAIKKGVDALLDKIEDSVTNSKNKIDDAVVLPLIDAIRQQLNIPDNDPEPATS